MSFAGPRDQFAASCSRVRCRSMRSLRRVLIAASPIAPPRLRIRLNRPEAFFTRSSGERAERGVGDRDHRAHQADAAENLRPEQLPEIPVLGHVVHLEGAEREQQEAAGQQEARVVFRGQPADERRGEEHREPGDEHRLADHQRIVAAHLGEIDRIEIGEPIEPDAEHEGEHAADGEIAVAEGVEVDDRHARGEHAIEERRRRERRRRWRGCGWSRPPASSSAGLPRARIRAGRGSPPSR